MFYKIPPRLPLPVFDGKKIPKGRIAPLWQRGEGGDFAKKLNFLKDGNHIAPSKT